MPQGRYFYEEYEETQKTSSSEEQKKPEVSTSRSPSTDHERGPVVSQEYRLEEHLYGVSKPKRIVIRARTIHNESQNEELKQNFSG